jgi:hypothetical protein
MVAGMARGATMLQRIRGQEAPSMSAASSMDLGRVLNWPM